MLCKITYLLTQHTFLGTFPDARPPSVAIHPTKLRTSIHNSTYPISDQ